ncbi:peptidoglycan DD-metalloendopeptidase family protein [Yoonia sp. R2331]|uniref:peptidoglycan DD-metalloendopeptidase family protein n=1 Tax=Yoonia sp. R2331 TaxID=3237238 RepID=UPI0034E520E0
MIEVDPAFQKSQARAKRRRAQRRIQRIAAGAGGVVLVLVLGFGIFWLFSGGDDAPEMADDLAPEEGQFVQVETEEVAAPPVRAATPFVDIAGDPMILRFETGAAQDSLSLSGPMTLDARRVGSPSPTRLSLVREPLIVQERQLITALPSSREDFAFFQAQRSASLNAPALPAAEVATPQDELDVVVVAADSDDSWGTALGEDDAAPASYVETRIENTTSVSFVRPEALRKPLYEDIVVRMITTRSIADVMATNGFATEAAETWAGQIATVIPEAAEMAPGSIVAIRARREGEALTPLQISLYGPQGYINSTARRGALGFEVAADPWVDVDLYALSSPAANIAAPQQDYRLLDAVYSAVIRKGVPTTLVGEMIVMMSQAYDLDAFAAPGDEVTVLYAPAPGPGGSGPGQILFAGITGPSGEMPCYVSADDDGKFSCFSNTGRAGAASQGGFTTPVQGTLTSKFGPRHHPILKTVRLHGGVDWAAPTGTPIVAALAGTLKVVGDGGGYGNVIYIDHPGGLQSRYAHMSRFGEGMRPGRQVQQGEVIGYVGTTGRSTGPHLHFEFRQNGTPVDPFTVNVQGGSVVASGGAASGAVEALVNQIIKVESAGNANAKNPLSTATGLGQFIESTWLRMMRDYRPDLAGTMSRADLLALRTDPTLSREMVTNLARENERFLSGRGHSITPGRLYLAHFLGPGGANTVLSRGDGETILAVMGSGVVNANPFLRNYTVADLKAWADRKMRGAGSGGGAVVSAPRPVMTAEMRAYKEVIDQLLSEAG